MATKKVAAVKPQKSVALIENNAGGAVFEAGAWTKLRRFLILGADAGAYYVDRERLQREQAKAVDACLTEDYRRAVDEIVQVSDSGAAPSNSPAIFALAMAASTGKKERKQYALSKLDKVCRIPTHLYEFHRTVRQWRGNGPGLMRAYRRWFTSKAADKLAFAGIKYASRAVGKDGEKDRTWAIRDLIRLSHPRTKDAEKDAVLRYLVGGAEQFVAKEEIVGDETAPYIMAQGRVVMRKGQQPKLYDRRDKSLLPMIVDGYEKAKRSTDEKEVAALIREYGLTHEMIPTEVKRAACVWEALLEKMPPEAMLRNLANMTKCGLLATGADATKRVVAKLTDADAIKKSRLHPLAILIGGRVYEQGRGERGSSVWVPTPAINMALGEAFELSFGNVEPTGKRILIGLDTSSSMTSGQVGGKPITPREAEAAMATVTLRVEDDVQVVGYTTMIHAMKLGKKTTFTEAINAISKLPCGGTDCAQPILHATKNKLDVDAIISFTDGETWAGKSPVHTALAAYRSKFNPEMKSVTVAMMASSSSLHGPEDVRSLDVVGFDTSTPAVISEFIKG